MNDRPETRRPGGDDERVTADRSADEAEIERADRDGGDADAAGSVAEREAIARDDDDTWGERGDAGADDRG